ncbi:MAG: gamma-glutamyl-gamma-aminobutyrate hydrolase family protein [Bacteroidota bacterium]
MRSLRIGITKGRNFHFYENWMLAVPGVEVIPLLEENKEQAAGCDGIIFSGGEDVDPACYGLPEYRSTYHLTDINEQRDRFELNLAKQVLDTDIPVLGICRGMQLINVHYGGTLIPDLPTFGKQPHSRDETGTDRRHQITIEPGSRLAEITALTEGTINSAHHQSVDKVAPGFKPVAVSTDGVIESIERIEPSSHYLRLVQWHPERMPDPENPLSISIRTDFLEAVRNNINH